MTEPVEYAAGGYIPRPENAPPIVMTLHPDECNLSSPDGMSGAECRRADHPTPTSDCSNISWIRHCDG